MSIISPIEQYHTWIQQGKLEANSEQARVLYHLTYIQKKLIRRHLFPIKGLYLWGGVGVGKTMIMDCFYETLPLTKMRQHFHVFMQNLHHQLNNLQGQANPLKKIGKFLAKNYKVICFDEFLVTNVTDAMLLTELFKTLFKKGICLITTANLAPDQLYLEGLQRERFLAVINLIYKHCQVTHLALKQDYRRQAWQQINNYYFPLNENSEQALWHVLQHCVDGGLSDSPIIINDREIPVKQRNTHMIWFEFNIICGRPRSQQDYIALAEKYAVILISNLPCLEQVSKDKLVSFINLIDILYDFKIRLIISAAVAIEQLYTKGPFLSEFQRTESRLIEMQSSNFQ